MNVGGRVIAAQRYRLQTLTVHSDALVLVLQGCKTLEAAGQRLDVLPGQAVLMARGSRWDVVNDPRGQGRYEALLLSFDEAMVQAAEPLAVQAGAAVVDSARVINADEELREATRRCLAVGPSAVAEALLRHRVQEVMLLLLGRGHSLRASLSLDWGEQLRRRVAQRPDADWTVAALAEAFHLSESTLRRRLRSERLSLAALVREVRLETALGLLQSAELSVGDVAQRCGWASHSRFSAAFRQRWGVAPSVVRG